MSGTVDQNQICGSNDSIDFVSNRSRLDKVALISWAVWIASFFLIAILEIAVYSNVLDGQFLFDDEHSIEKNPSIRSVFPLSRSLWGPPYSPTEGRPVVNLSFALNYSVHGLKVEGYHVVSILIHILNTFILFALVFRTLKNSPWGERPRGKAYWLALTISLLWALHPLQTESVSYMTQRTELLMSCFFLLTLFTASCSWHAETRISQFVWQSICVLSCALGMASKEVMIVAPMMVLLYDVTILNHSRLLIMKHRLPLYMCLLATWGILLSLVAMNPRGRTVGFDLLVKPHEYLTTQFWVTTRYVKLAFWPTDLCGDYGIFKITEMDRWVPCFIFLLILAGLSLWSFFRWKWLAFLGAWFFLILAPTSSILPIIPEPAAERRMYLPLAALICLVVISVTVFFERMFVLETTTSMKKQRLSRWLLVFMAIGIVGLFASWSFARNRVYQNETSFWTDVIQKRPNNPRAFQHLGIVHLRKQNWSVAFDYFQKSEQLNPNDSDALFNLAIWHTLRGQPTDAIQYFDRVLALDPKNFEAMIDRAKLHYALGRIDEAILDYRSAIEVSPISHAAHLNLGDLLYSQGELDEALVQYRTAHKLNPNSAACALKIAVIHSKKGENQEAIPWFEKALTLDPQNLDACKSAGYSYTMIGQFDKATKVFELYTAMQPNHFEGWTNLGHAYVNNGQPQEAQRCFEKALSIQPSAIEPQIALQHLHTLYRQDTDNR